MSEDDKKLDLALEQKKLELAFEQKKLELRLEQIKLAKYGLRGTLYGTFAALGAITIIASAQIYSGKNIVEGWAFATMVIVIAVAVVFYGLFIFDRSLTLESKWFKGKTD